MEIGLVKRVDIDQEMQQSYLDYAMSVIVARALPDARDGLKPVQRRILFGMYDMGLRADSGYKKSARIVGEVLGKYHPHGDQAVYEAMARMAQDFTMRYPLIDGQGNFGSVDGDPPAAMRYTEARLAPAALELLTQLDRNTVNFTRNFDDTLNEPEVLPAAIPNLLVNGTSGIAVGMATSIPPHNLDEVIGALGYMLAQWEKLEDVSVSDLMKFVKGPDFPTGGIILQENRGEDLLSAYATGRGKVTLRGRVHLEEMGRGKSRIIISELPYQINKASLIERIAELAREGVLEGISDLRDESDRRGMRIVIELSKVAGVENVLRELYKRTPLQTTFRISLLALVDGEPRLLSLKQALRVYLEHRINVVKRRSEYDLEKARQRAHILEGLRLALQNLDEVIKIIRSAQDVDDARTKLMKRFKLSEIQANAILEMQLRRLAALERKKIELEYRETKALIEELESLLRSAKKLRLAVLEELLQIKAKFGDKRRTQIVSLREGAEKLELLTTSDVVPVQTVWVGVSEEGVIGRITDEKLARQSGKLAPRWIIRTTTHHTLYLAATDGRCAAIAVPSLPEVENFADGVKLHKVSPFEENQIVAQIFALPAKQNGEEEHFIVTVSRKGLIKKSNISELPGPSTQLFTLAKVNPGDALGWVFESDGKADFILATRNGMLIRFPEDDVRPMGLIAAGVNGIKLLGDDELIGAAVYQPAAHLLLVCANGRGWRIPSSDIPRQGRYGQGVIACRPEKLGGVSGFLYGKPAQAGFLHLAQSVSKNLRVDVIPAGKRQSAAKEVLSVRQGDRVTGITPLDLAGEDTEKRGAPARGKRSTRPEEAEVVEEIPLPLPGLFDDGGTPAPRSRMSKDSAGAVPGVKAGKTSSRRTATNRSAGPTGQTAKTEKAPPRAKKNETGASPASSGKGRTRTAAITPEASKTPANRTRSKTASAETKTAAQKKVGTRATIKPAAKAGQSELPKAPTKSRAKAAPKAAAKKPAAKKPADSQDTSTRGSAASKTSKPGAKGAGVKTRSTK
jgi:DNA gyrase subunit A